MPITKEQIENDFNTYKYTNPAICTPQQIKLSEYIRECQRLMELNQNLQEERDEMTKRVAIYDAYMTKLGRFWLAKPDDNYLALFEELLAILRKYKYAPLGENDEENKP